LGRILCTECKKECGTFMISEQIAEIKRTKSKKLTNRAKPWYDKKNS